MDSERLAVSVIVPVYNVEKYLDRCLESLAYQTLNDIEIIVVNDGTQDQSQLIIDKYVKLFPDRFISLKKENGGLSDARNYGLPYAKGEYIGFVDSDDYTDIYMFEKLYKKATEESSDIVVCGYYGIDERNGSFKQFQKGNMDFFNKSLKEEPSLLYLNSTYAWNKIYKKDLFLKTGITYPKGVLFEDMAVTWSLFPHANKISKVDEPLYFYILKREGAITATYSDKMLQMFDSMALVNDYYKSINIYDEYYDVLCFVNMKHTFIRIKDFTNYKNQRLKDKFIKRGLKHLAFYFPDWKSNDLFFKRVYGRNKLMKLFKFTVFWKIYSYIPCGFIQITASTKKNLGGMKKALKKRNYITKYIYAFDCKKKPIIKKQVLFESFQGSTMSDSPFYMMQELCKDDSYSIYYAVKKEVFKECKKRLREMNLNIRLIKTYSMTYQHALASSEYLVNNVSFPPYVIRRSGQKYINTWHGTPLKTLGKQMNEGIQDMSNIQRNFLQSTTLLFPNIYTYEHMMEDYHLFSLYTKDVLISGYPRNTIFKESERACQIKKKYHLDNMEQIAYMPTWRGSASTELEVKNQLIQMKSILKTIEESLSEKQICFVNLHTLIGNKIDYTSYHKIRPFPTDIDTYQFLNSCDCLITDYSSVFFDFSITKKPIALYVYDLKEYISERGMYLDIVDLPFTILKTQEDLKAFISQEKKDVCIKKRTDYDKTFLQFDSTQNTKIVNRAFFYNETENMNSWKENEKKKFTLYFMPKIVDSNDESYFKTILKDTTAILVFDRSDFTPITQKLLSMKYKNNFTYIIMDVRMQLTLKEQLYKLVGKKLSSEVYQRELQRILPNLSFKRCIDFKNSEYTREISNMINRKGL